MYFIKEGQNDLPFFCVKILHATKLRPNKWKQKKKSFVIILILDTYKTLSCARDRTILIISIYLQYVVIVSVTKNSRAKKNIEIHQNVENVTKI